MSDETGKHSDNDESTSPRAHTRQLELDRFIEDNKNNQSNERNVKIRDLVDLPSTTYGAFGLYRYPAKFIPHVVAYVLEQYAAPRMKVFDPFAGYGTVGVVSRLYGHDYELWDLNPILEILHAVTLLRPKRVDLDALMSNVAMSKEEFVPEWSNFDYWFAEDFRPLLSGAWGFYHSLEDEYLRLLLTIPLLKVCRYYSYDDMGRMKLSKSPRSKQRISDLLLRNWKSKFFNMLETETQKVIKRLQEHNRLSPKETKAVVRGSVDTLTRDLDEEKDLLITSPPYLQSQEYIRHAKMDLFWLGHTEDEIRALNRLEVPYRKVKEHPINSETYSSIRNEIDEDHIRQIYERYFWAIAESLGRLQKQVGSFLFLFVGRSSLRGRPVPIDQILAEHFSDMGWVHEETLVDTIVARRMFSYQVNPATKIKDSRTATEHLVVLRRP